MVEDIGVNRILIREVLEQMKPELSTLASWVQILSTGAISNEIWDDIARSFNKNVSELLQLGHIVKLLPMSRAIRTVELKREFAENATVVIDHESEVVVVIMSLEWQLRTVGAWGASHNLHIQSNFTFKRTLLAAPNRTALWFKVYI